MIKKITLALLIITTFMYISCKKGQDGPGEIYGRWKLTETLADPGDGSGVYTKVKGAAKYINIDRSGKIEGDAIPEILSYKILDSVQIEVTTKSYDKPLIYQYKVTSNTLTINPPCIEGCGYRFIKK